MKPFNLLLFISLCFACATGKKTNTKASPLNATWIPVKQEIAGNEFPKSVFEKQTLVINDTNYTVTAESLDKGIIKINGNKMDIYGKEGVNAGKHFTAIYKLINEQLTICYNLTGGDYPEAFETKGKRAYFLSVFKKEAAIKK